MKEINRILIQCTSEDDAGRLEEVLESNGIDIEGESLINLWQVFRRHTVFEIHNGKVRFQSDSYYTMKKEYSQWDFVSVETFLKGYRPSGFSFKRLLRAVLYAVVVIIAASVITYLVSFLMSNVPMWVSVVATLVIAVLLTYKIS